jgi:hypothetical protein
MNQEEKIFIALGSPIFWKEKARDLKFSAETLYPFVDERLDKLTELLDKGEDLIGMHPPDVFGIYLMLTGNSLEALLKGIIIRENPTFLFNGVMSKKIRTHNLFDLADIAEVRINFEEGLYFEAVMEYMFDYGRYPIPKSAKDRKINRGKNPHRYDCYGKDEDYSIVDVYNGLFDRLSVDLDQSGVRTRKINCPDCGKIH